MSNDLSDAIKKDLGRDRFTTWLSESSYLEKEIDHTISNLHKWSKATCVDTPMYIGPAKSKIVYEPLGVVCIMGSWNFPLVTTIGPLINAIAAGNCAVIKPSEISPNTLLKIKSLVTRWLDMQSYACIEG